MAFVVEAVMEVLRQRTVGGVISGLALISAPLWAAVLVGLLVGWAWKPTWAASLVGGAQAGPSALSYFDFGYVKAQLPGFITSLVSDWSSRSGEKDPTVSPMSVESEGLAVTKEDLEHLWQLVEGTDGGLAWHQMMDKRLPSMSYRAWRRDPETGPPQYRSSTVFEDATPEIVRDFFWDDDFRLKSKWDDMLIHHATLEECPMTGTVFVHWIRKFPFFCSNREYTIGRRIWKFGTAYYCVTKGVPCLSVPRRNKPRRVDLYYSSWCIRSVESRKGDGQLTACEVLLFHHEDMGIPWEIAKLGVRQGMWGCVRKIEPGLRAYQMARSSNEPLSQSVKMAQVTTKVDSNYLKSLKINTNSSVTMDEAQEKKTWGRSVPKLFVVGGAVALGCSLDRGLLTKAIIFGVARRFMKQGRRL